MKDILRRFCLLFMSFCIAWSVIPCLMVSADGTETLWEGDYQVVYGNSNEIIRFHQKKDKEECYFEGKHAISTATISYWTVGYNISLHTNTDGNVTALGNKVKQIKLEGQPEDYVDGNNVITKYYLDRDKLIKYIQELLMQKHNNDVAKVNDEFVSGVDVYFNNIFRVYRRTGGSGTFKPAEKDFFPGELHNKSDFLANQSWGEGTRKVIPYYYNIKLRISVEPYTYDVVIVDEEGNELLTAMSSQSIFKNGLAEYKISSDWMTIESNGKTYEFAGNGGYTYKGGGTTAVKVEGNTVGAVHLEEKDAVLKIVYKEVPGPSPTPEPTAGPPNRKETVEKVKFEYMYAQPEGEIRADQKGNEQYDVAEGIPTKESLYGLVRSESYLYSTMFNVVTGEITYQVPVRKTYNLSWSSLNPVTGVYENRSASETVYQIVTIKREYKFTSIDEIAYYQIDNARLKNYALPGGELMLSPVGYSVPELKYKVYGGTNSHIVEPEGVKGIVLPAGNISGGTSRPSYTVPDFTSEADSKIDEIKVKNDLMTFGGASVLNDTQTDKAAPALSPGVLKVPEKTADSMLYKAGNVIDGQKSNGTHASQGNITYKQIIRHNSSKNASLIFSINGINSVSIHTPVYCSGQLVNDNKKYVQLINPDNGCVPVVLDQESRSSDFVVQITNTGYHSGMKGYGTRDYSKYVMRNEVIFPFDAYIDIGNDSSDANDVLLKAGTWHTITGNQRFHVPMWVKEDIYTVSFRAVAVNGAGKEGATQVSANTVSSKYAASNTERVQVSGKVFGLTLYDIGGDEMWKPVFTKYQSLNLKINVGGTDGTMTGQMYDRNSIYYYTVGTSNQYGISTGRNSRYTFPLIYGSHPHEMNQGVSKAGYSWKFTLQTTGGVMMEDASYVDITPRFYYVDKNGQGRQEVDIYYTAKIGDVRRNLVKVGSEMDALNLKTAWTSDIAIPEAELKATAAIRKKTLKEWRTQRDVLYTYAGIKTKTAFKTYSNSSYAELIRKRPSGTGISITDDELTRRKQTYYFSYSMTNTFHAVNKGFDISTYSSITYKEDFWKKDGYIIIQFDIVCYDKNGNAYLSYINGNNYLSNGNCSMWVMEGVSPTKTDYYGTEFSFKAGDVILMDVDKTSADDYYVGGIY